ncbi:MAG: 2-dehydropantoate 2-reductase [Methanobrevibacter thaueri]|jgi:2-dehydropantoate 2-reductase|uniref:ketopantoate reductase family protein n=1 Tax=Methanobrevibacter thaueri TaxID=190975 RepID=UPI0026F1FDCC|nr:2-dehydropantoate 2-reductase [Methanobrevibacter thaueri]MBE6496083.1 2-dehydropantoate 2-reductase [Methanobrevibacter thaueri]
MNILVIGAGAVGIGLAASLASQGENVSIYARGETARAIRENGIRRVGLFEHIKIENLPVYDDYNDIPENTFDYIIIASKTTANEDISDNLNNQKDILKESGKILIVQNGFGNDEPYLRYFPKKQVYCARIITGFARPERHISEVTVYTEPMQLGSLQNQDTRCLQEIADLITASGIKCEVTDEVDKYLWAKMLYNCALNPLGAILNKTYGELTENPYTLDIMNSIIDEIFEVIKASPYETFWANADEYRDVFYSKLVPDTYNHYSSTHHDLQNRKRTEIDSLNGKVIQLGEANNVNVKTNKFIYNLIKAIENSF